MIRFPDQVELCPLSVEQNGRGVFEVGAAFPVRFELFGQALTYVVTAGRRTDGASIPWWARGEFDPWGRDGLPGLLHDMLLQDPAVTLPKWLIDLVLLWALRSCGVGELRATLMFLAVRTRPRDPAPTRPAGGALARVVSLAAVLAGCTIAIPGLPSMGLQLSVDSRLAYRQGASRPKIYTGLRASVLRRP